METVIDFILKSANISDELKKALEQKEKKHDKKN